MTKKRSRLKILIIEILIILLISTATSLLFNHFRAAGIALWYQPPKAKPRTDLTIKQVLKIHSAGQTLFIDARNAADFSRGHIDGAINVSQRAPKSEKMDLLKDISKDGKIIVYCSDARCPLAERLAAEMKFMGYTQVRVFRGGWLVWKFNMLKDRK